MAKPKKSNKIAPGKTHNNLLLRKLECEHQSPTPMPIANGNSNLGIGTIRQFIMNVL
jgi:hypothetical protein